jgi:hypothetical protein
MVVERRNVVFVIVNSAPEQESLDILNVTFLKESLEHVLGQHMDSIGYTSELHNAIHELHTRLRRPTESPSASSSQAPSRIRARYTAESPSASSSQAAVAPRGSVAQDLEVACWTSGGRLLDEWRSPVGQIWKRVTPTVWVARATSDDAVADEWRSPDGQFWKKATATLWVCSEIGKSWDEESTLAHAKSFFSSQLLLCIGFGI